MEMKWNLKIFRDHAYVIIYQFFNVLRNFEARKSIRKLGKDTIGKHI